MTFEPPNADDLDESIPPPAPHRSLFGRLQELAVGIERHRAPAVEGGPERGYDDLIVHIFAAFTVATIFVCLIALGFIVGWIFAGAVTVAGVVWAGYMLLTNRDGPGGLPDWYHHW